MNCAAWSARKAPTTIQAILAGAQDKESGMMATIIADVLLLVGATSVFAELKDSLDEIWHVPAPKDAGWWDTVRTRVLSFGLILVLGFLLLVSLVVSAATGGGRKLSRRHVERSRP